VLRQFVGLKSQIESTLLLGDYDLCDESLDRLEKELGFSIWLLEMKIAVLQTSRGLEAQKAYSSQVRGLRPDGDLISFLAHFMSWRNEDTTNPFQFKKTVSQRASDWQVDDEYRTHMLYKLTGECSLDDAVLSTILRYEASYSLIDYYESFIRLAIGLISNEKLLHSSTFNAPLLTLIDIIPDARLVKLASVAVDDGFQYLKRSKARSLSSDDALLAADYEAVQNYVELQAREYPDDIHLWDNLALAELNSGRSPSSVSGLGTRFTRLLKAVMKKESEYKESVLEGARLILNYGNLPSSAQFESFFWQHMSSAPNLDRSTQLAAFLSSRFLEPAVLRFMSKGHQLEFARLLDETYGDHRAIDFYKWLAGDNNLQQDGLHTRIDPFIFKEVLIEHFAMSEHYDNALALARKVEAEAAPRYRRIAQRWIAHCLFASGKIDDAIDYVCHVFISDRDCLLMMPFARCASALDKARRAALAGKLSTPIVLDIYDREFDSAFESERNYAYEDFLTAHGLQRPSQLKEVIVVLPPNLDSQGLVF
jgi:hypothetical protein